MSMSESAQFSIPRNSSMIIHFLFNGISRLSVVIVFGMAFVISANVKVDIAIQH